MRDISCHGRISARALVAADKNRKFRYLPTPVRQDRRRDRAEGAARGRARGQVRDVQREAHRRPRRDDPADAGRGTKDELHQVHARLGDEERRGRGGGGFSFGAVISVHHHRSRASGASGGVARARELRMNFAHQPPAVGRVCRSLG